MQTYIIHVKGNTAREQFILSEVNKKGLVYEFILEGNKEEITDEIRSKYFGTDFQVHFSAVSCALKHIKAYERMVAKNLPYALILEDDIMLNDDFNPILLKIIDEIKSRNLSNLLISLEDSLLQYVERSQLIKNQILYKKKYGRMAGAYFIDLACAKTLLDTIKKDTCNKPIDWFHNQCADNELLTIYWSQPVIACQGSLNGKMHSLLENKPYGLLRQLSFGLQRYYKKMVYFFR